MKKFQLLSLALLFVVCSHAQLINKTTGSDNASIFSIDVNSKYTKLGEIIQPGSLHERGVKRTLPFLEFGDGAFSTQPQPIHIVGRQDNPVLLFAASIYDTTKPYPTRLVTYPATFSSITTVNPGAAYATNDQAILPAGKSIFITSNVNEIVPGDYNNFAITYKLTNDTAKYRLLLYYNNNAIFNVIDGTLPCNLPAVRLYYGDQLQTGVNYLSANWINPAISYQQCLVVECGQVNGPAERNAFFTAYTDPTVAINNVTSVYAVLIASTNQGQSWNKVDDYFINSMPVAIAHDPNYIRQTGQCILLPRKEKQVKYHVHFQNDGHGAAGQVDVLVRLPPGITNSNIKFGSANCGGTPFKFTPENTQYDPETSTLSFSFKSEGRPYILKGTDDNVNPFNNPNTMGDIFFQVEESVITKDTLAAMAEIYFYNAGDGKKLAPVKTNLATSVYREACDDRYTDIRVDTATYWRPDCRGCNNCTRLLYICWYWWVIIFLLLALAYWWNRRRISAQGPDET